MSHNRNEIIANDRNRAAVLAHLRSAAKPVQAKHLAAQTGLPVYAVGNYLKALRLAGLAEQAAPREGAKVAAFWIAAIPPQPPPLPVVGYEQSGMGRVFDAEAWGGQDS